jgi:tRNA-modifying protein YgfZ
VGSVATKTYIRPRAYVRVKGPDAADLLQRIVSNDVLAAESCEALILTPKGRVIAPLLVWRRDDDDFLLLTEPELGETVRAHLTRMRFAAKCEIELEEHVSTIVLGGSDGIRNDDYGVPAVEVLDGSTASDPADEGLERLRILARTPRWGPEIDEGILPAEAGLDLRAVSFTKGCYPGQEPLARLQHRGHVNRSLRVIEADSARPAQEIAYEGRVVGRITSVVPGLGLGYVRVEVPEGAAVEVGGRPARIASS